MKYLEFGKPFFCALGFLLIQFLLQEMLSLAGLSAGEASALGSIILALLLSFFSLFYSRFYGKEEETAERKPVSVMTYAWNVIWGICLGIVMHGLGTEKSTVVSPLLIIGFGIAGPVAEEIIYRGYVLKKGESLFGTRKAVCLSVLLFAVAHETPSAIFFAGIAGFLFSVSYLRTGKLLSPILFHITVNLCSFFLPMAVVHLYKM